MNDHEEPIANVNASANNAIQPMALFCVIDSHPIEKASHVNAANNAATKKIPMRPIDRIVATTSTTHSISKTIPATT